VYKLRYGYVKNETVKKKCKQCGKEFETNIRTKEYCSSECQKVNQESVYIKVDKRQVECPVCGAEFKTGHQHKKFCSRICYLIAKKGR